MSADILPRLNPKFRELTQSLLESSEQEKKIRMRLLKQKCKAGVYKPSSLALAKSLMTPALLTPQSDWQGSPGMKHLNNDPDRKKE